MIMFAVFASRRRSLCATRLDRRTYAMAAASAVTGDRIARRRSGEQASAVAAAPSWLCIAAAWRATEETSVASLLLSTA